MSASQIKLPVVTEGKEMMVNFIVVHAFSPYTAILAWLWIHAIGAMLSMLHLKVKFPTKQEIVVIWGDQSIARWLVATINDEIKQIKQFESNPL